MYRTRRVLKQVVIHAILLFFALCTLAPFLWMVTTSLKLPENVMRMPPQWIPNPATLRAYVEAFATQPLFRSMVNSLSIALVNVFGGLFTASLAAFAFSKLRFRHKNKIFGVLMTSMMIPSQVALIPMYVVYSRIGWVDTYLPLTLPAIFLNIYGVFMIRQFMSSIPNAYLEAARIDGAGFGRIYTMIFLPLCRPILVTLGLFSFIGSWNNFMTPLVMLNSPEKFTVPLLITVYKAMYNVDWALLMAASTISILPTVILFLCMQRFFVKGVVTTGLKG